MLFNTLWCNPAILDEDVARKINVLREVFCILKCTAGNRQSSFSRSDIQVYWRTYFDVALAASTLVEFAVSMVVVDN